MRTILALLFLAMSFQAHATFKVEIVGVAGFPPGGTTGQVLVKNSDDDYDQDWATLGIQTTVSATAVTITGGQCGSTFKNTGAVAINLPEASAVIGCKLTFITANASNFDINPDDADQILVQTNAAGDSIRNATLGNSITLQAISSSQWAPVAVVGTWTDIN